MAVLGAAASSLLSSLSGYVDIGLVLLWDIDTFVPVSSSIFTRSYETERVSFLSGMTAAWFHGVYTFVQLFVQINVVPLVVWKMLPRMNQTCGGLQKMF